MKRYLRLFESHADYNRGIMDFIYPNVSYCKDMDDVHYNPLDGMTDYLTMVVLDDGVITFTYHELLSIRVGRYMEYSIDDGDTWVRLENVDGEFVSISVDVSVGDVVKWRGSNDALGTYVGQVENAYGSCFTSTCRFNVYGNIHSLLYVYPRIFGSFSELELDEEYTFSYLFCDLEDGRSCRVVDASGIVFNPSVPFKYRCYQGMFEDCSELESAPALPSTFLSEGCYSWMFHNCESLTNAPVLPAVSLSRYCYDEMFSGCVSLGYVKAMFTTVPGVDYTNGWLSGVSDNGTFVKNVEASWDVVGDNGVPSGWTVEVVSE